MGALGDIETEILAFVNKALRKSYAAGEIDIAIQSCLNDLAKENRLIAQDTSQTLVAGGATFDFPTDYKEPISIVLINGSSVRQAPLVKLPEAFPQYEELRDNDSATGEPEWFTEGPDNKIYLWRNANGAYTSEITYFRYHPQTPNTILFDEQYRQAIFYGTTFFEAALLGIAEKIAIWNPLYSVEKETISIPVTTIYVTR